MRRRASTAALIAVTAALALAGCSSDDAAAPEGTAAVDGPSAGSPAPSGAASPDAASVTACTAYAGATENPRQVVTTSSTKPVSGAALALALVNVRGVAAGIAVPVDPQLQEAFTEVVAAVDELSEQATAALPEGADPIQTTVTIDPTRLDTALDTADELCTARGVSPKAG